MSNNQSDRRTLKRRQLLFYLEIYNLADNQLLGHLGDITTEGLMIVSEKALPLKKSYQVKVKLPKLPEFQKDFMQFDIETRWAQKDINPDLQCTGAIFTHSDQEYLIIIQHLIRVLGFNN